MITGRSRGGEGLFDHISQLSNDPLVTGLTYAPNLLRHFGPLGQPQVVARSDAVA